MSTPTAGPTGSAPQPNSADSVAQQFIAAQGSGTTTGKPDAAFQEYGPTSRPQSEYEHGTALQSKPIVTRSVTDMSNDYYSWSDSQRQDFRNKLALIDKSALTAPDSTIANAWGDYVQQSANYLAAGMTLSPEDILDKDVAVKSNPSQAATTSQTTSDTTLTSKVDANAIFQSAAQSLLGRAATASESSAFQSLLNSQEQQNPTNATITTTTDANGNTTASNRTTTGGVSAAAAAQMAQDQARQNPESGAYQAATTYMNALMALVGRSPA